MDGNGWCRRGVLAIAVGLVLCVAACDEARGDDPIQVEPYQIEAIDIRADGERESWAFGDDHIERWFRAALEESDRGISESVSGMGMQAVIHHQVRIDNLRRGARLVITVEAQAERSLVNGEDPMVTLRATRTYRHLLARGQPAEGVLHALSRTLARQAVDDVVHQLRLRARIRQSNPVELVSWIENSTLDSSVRRYAIRRALIYTPKGLERSLIQVSRDDDERVAELAARGLFEMESSRAPHALMDVAQRLSRAGDYDRYLAILPLLADVEVAWVAIYLETVAHAHDVQRVRTRARALNEDRDHLQDL